MNKLEVENKLKDSPIVRIPKEWEMSTLGNLASYINGYAFKPEDWEESGLPIIRIEQLKNPDAKCDYFDKKLTDIYLINDGDLIFSWSATLFLKIWNRGTAYLNQHLYKVITKSVVKKIFLRYLIEFNIDKLYKETHGSTMQHITRPLLLKFKIILPPLHEQQKIAEILETVDETIEKTDAIIEKYKRIKQGLMQDLLTRGITAFEFEKGKLIAAVKRVFDSGDHRFGREENLVSHLSRHLNEFFPGWDVDSEVEKNNDRQRPDIIIHKRRTDENLFAIEVKKNENLNAIKQDCKKLEDVMFGNYHYEDIIFIGFDIENFQDIFKLSEKVNFILVSKNGEIKVKPRVREFKDSLLGKIPKEWKVMELGKVGNIIYGGRFSEKDYDDYGRAKVFGTGGVIAKTNRIMDRGEAIILPRKGTINNKFYVEDNEAFWVIDTAYYIKAITKTNLKYVSYFLDRVDFNLFNEATGVPSLNRNTLKSIVIPLSDRRHHRKRKKIQREI
jgi:restriction endonuclease S subunit